MTYSRQRLKKVTALKRAAVRRIQSAIAEIDASPSRKYIQEFNREFQSFQSVCDTAEILEQAQHANLIWVSDYHALVRSQTYATEFIRELAERKNDLAIAVEPVFARNQEVLDVWMAGKISEQEFLDRVHYQEEWGCEWEGYKAIFTIARELHIPIYGVDCHPRNDMRSISRRDRGVARRIGRLMEKNPERTLVVIFGESHLASNHLPRRVRDILASKAIESKELLIVQNIDALYWKLQETDFGEARAVRVRDDYYCVFNATPIEKYESFRQYLHKCIEEDSCGDWT